MPPKKSSAQQQPQQQPSAATAGSASLLVDGGDPIASAIAIIEKKARNLEKRKNRLVSLKESEEQGTVLDKDQLDAIKKIDNVMIQLELVKELQKQFQGLNVEHQKARKKQQRLEKQQQKDVEREAQRRAASYTLRVQDILNGMDDEAKESFRTGSGEAVALTEAELTHLDDLYHLLAPVRADNPNYQSDLEAASEHILQLLEQSTKEVVGTTYKNLYDLLERIDQSGYFDRPSNDPEPVDEDEDDDSEEAEGESRDVTAATEGEVPADVIYSEQEAVVTEQQVVPTQSEAGDPQQYLPPSGGPVAGQPMITPLAQQGMIGYMPSAPSPTFPALGTNPLQPVQEDGFSFMHESEVDRTQALQQAQATPQQPPALPQQQQQQLAAQHMATTAQSQPLDYGAYVATTAVQGGREQQTLQGNMLGHPDADSGAVSGQSQPSEGGSQSNTTDVATGQPGPSVVDPAYQPKVMELASHEPQPQQATSAQAFTAQQQRDDGMGYRQQQQYSQPRMGGASAGAPPYGRGGGRGQWGNRRGGGGGGPRGQVYQNGRGGQGYPSYGSGGQGRYSGGQRGGGRPNYRTSGPPRK